MPVGTPFIVMGLPRSRTYWLSSFLSYGDYSCSHEEIRHVRSLSDVKTWLSQDFTGTSETGAASWWRLIIKYRPDIKILIVRRPVSEVIDSLMRLDMKGVCAFDRNVLTRHMNLFHVKLDQIARRVPNAKTINFHDLKDEWACRLAFEHCLPYRHDRTWWETLRHQNLQCDMPGLIRYATAFKGELDQMGAIAKQSILADFALRRPVSHDGMTIQQESFETFYRDGTKLFAQHLAQVNERPDAYLWKNHQLARAMDEGGGLQVTTARANGRMFGYLMTVIGPSLEDSRIRSATDTTFYASPDIPGLGLRLERSSIQGLRGKGVHDIWMRAGVRGSGPKMGSLYKRIGAVPDGQLYRLMLQET